MALRRSILLVFGTLVAILVVRDLSVRAPSSHPISRLSRFWPAHPDRIQDDLKLMAATAALRQKPLPDEGRKAAAELLAKEPLATTPLLLAGAEAQVNGDRPRAEALYRSARNRDPRSPAARMLLADLLMRSGKVESGLYEMLALTRVTRQSEGLAQALAEYARDPGSLSALRPVLEKNAGLRNQVLGLLSRRAGNAPVVLALAPKSAQERPWEEVLINAFVTENKLEDAFGLWRRFTPDEEPQDLLRNSSFSQWNAASPFNWKLTPGNAGLVEFRKGGGLAIIYYGRDTSTFARQLTILQPGLYRLQSIAEGDASLDHPLFWRLRCQGGQVIADLPLARTGEFRVPPDCKGLWLELAAQPEGGSETTEILLKNVQLDWIGQ